MSMPVAAEHEADEPRSVTSKDAPQNEQGETTHVEANNDALRDEAVDSILALVAESVSRERLPWATYRFQFQQGFSFRDAAAAAPYLQKVGVSHLYASPFLKAKSGSSHGYDIVDHTQLNPELGTDEDFGNMVQALHDHSLGHVLDFVPNHMGVGSDENLWWQDVLENGPSSVYAHFFDVDWQPPKQDIVNKLMLPVLGDQYGSVLEEQQLTLTFKLGAFSVEYFGRQFPIAPRSYALILRHRLDELAKRLGEENPQFLEYQSILTALSHLPSREETDPARVQERNREKEIIKQRLRRLSEESLPLQEFLQETLVEFNGRRGESHSFDLLDGLLQEQAYRLSYWRVAADEINYRRFFDVNELAAVCMENPDVFEKSHARVLQLLDEGKIDGLRIDHADGLYSPTEYLWQLQKRRFLQRCAQAYARWRETNVADADSATLNTDEVMKALQSRYDQWRTHGSHHVAQRSMYLVVEKILEGHETLPADWPVHGTTGYEFLNQVNGLFVEPSSDKALETLYERFIGRQVDFEELVYHCKRLILRVSMAGELHVLAHHLDRISEQSRRSRDFTLNGLTHALREVIACFTVYRTYTTSQGILGRDRQYVEQAVARAKRRNPAVNVAVFDFVRDVLLLQLPGTQPAKGTATSGDSSPAPTPPASDYDREQVLRFIGRFQQFTGPIMAKSVEDTAFYQYHRLISLNEVGGNPCRFGVSADDFHRFNASRQANSPWALSATATHDTKRGEDTRARINVLSEFPQRWRECVLQWGRMNKRKKTKIEGELAPSRNDEYLLYQTLLGTWPFEAPKGEQLQTYIARIQRYMIKATREAKVHSSWIAPNEAYDRATCEFIASILAEDPISAFRMEFEPLARTVSACGVWNSLSQTLLKILSPGVPDIYQGTELWDFSLVDPDNRAPVDCGPHAQLLKELPDETWEADRLGPFIAEVVKNPTDGRIKLWLVSTALRLRREQPHLFSKGEYLPLAVRGAKSNHAIAFARKHEEQAAIVVVPRFTASLGEQPGQPPVGADVWGDTEIVLPERLQSATWKNWLTGRTVNSSETIAVAKILELAPVGVLVAKEGS